MTDQRRGPGESGSGQGKTAALLAHEIGARHRHIIETELRQEVRAMSYRINPTLGNKSCRGTLDDDNGRRFFRRPRFVGSAHHAKNVGAFAIPAGKERPILLDIALSAVAAGKIFAAKALSQSIPSTWLTDAEGMPVTEVGDWPASGSMLPMAGHKGYGLALLIEGLASLLTGAGMLDCRNALVETDGDLDKAVELLRAKGVAAAGKRQGAEASEGVVQSYIHANNRIGAIVEVDCQTDFVARNEKFVEFARDVALHVAAANPLAITEEEVPEEDRAREERIAVEQAADRPENVRERIVKGKLDKWLDEVVLLRQKHVNEDKHDGQTIEQLRAALSAETRENIVIDILTDNSSIMRERFSPREGDGRELCH